MVIEKLKVNHLENPLGYQLDGLSLSWVVREAEGSHTAMARVRIALDETMERLVHDSGERTDVSSVNYAPALTLEPETRYFWQVEVWDDAGDHGKSAAAFFEN